MSVEDIEIHNAVLIAQDNTVKREYMGEGVKRIEIKVFCKLCKHFHMILPRLQYELVSFSLLN